MAASRAGVKRMTGEHEQKKPELAFMGRRQRQQKCVPHALQHMWSHPPSLVTSTRQAGFGHGLDTCGRREGVRRLLPLAS